MVAEPQLKLFPCLSCRAALRVVGSNAALVEDRRGARVRALRVLELARPFEGGRKVVQRGRVDNSRDRLDIRLTALHGVVAH